MPTSPLTRLVLVVSAVAMCLGACTTVRLEERRGAFWEAFRIGPAIDEVSHFETLAEMLAASDGVVIARVNDIHVSRIFQGEAPEDRFPYVRVELVVDRVIAGKAPATVQLEFMGGGTGEGAEAVVAALRAKLPADSAIFFLHAKRGANEAGLYRVTNSTGLWAPTTRSMLDSPLREEPPEVSGLYAAELATIDDMAGLVSYLESLPAP